MKTKIALAALAATCSLSSADVIQVASGATTDPGLTPGGTVEDSVTHAADSSAFTTAGLWDAGSSSVGGGTVADTLYYAFTARSLDRNGDWPHPSPLAPPDSAFGGVNLYLGATQGVLVGNMWGSWAFGAIIGGAETHLLDGGGLLTIDPSVIPTILVEVEFVANAADNITVTASWGGTDYTTTGIADASFDQFLLRSGHNGWYQDYRSGGGGGWVLDAAVNNRWEFSDVAFATTAAEAIAAINDTDGDGLPDTWEQQIIDHSGGTLTLADIEGPLDTPPVNSDYDMDGATDADEYANGTDPVDNDSDNDNLLDGVEDNTDTWDSPSQTGTDPLDNDSDDDGLLDGVETNDGSNDGPTDTGTNPNLWDTDLDDFPDGLEVNTGTNPNNTNPPYPPTGDLAVIGTDDFESYGDGPLAGKTGGSGFDFDNDGFDDPPFADIFVGHTMSFADWDETGSVNSPQIVSGTLVTVGNDANSGASAIRQYNGPGEGNTAGGDEHSGAVNTIEGVDSAVVYYRIDLTRGAATSWSGLSSREFGTNLPFFGVPWDINPVSGVREFGIQDSAVLAFADPGIAPVAGKAYTIVAKIDLDTGLLSLWVNPDLTKTEGENTADVTHTYTASNWSTAVRVTSGGSDATTFDHLVVGREWSALGVFPGVEPDDDYDTWIALFPEVGGLTGFDDDIDMDGLGNGVENVLGTSPSVWNQGLTEVSSTATTATFRHSQSNTIASDITPSYEWSTDLVTWHPSGEDVGGLIVDIDPVTITDNGPPDNDLIEVTVTVPAGSTPRLFVRLKATQD